MADQLSKEQVRRAREAINYLSTLPCPSSSPDNTDQGTVAQSVSRIRSPTQSGGTGLLNRAESLIESLRKIRSSSDKKDRKRPASNVAALFKQKSKKEKGKSNQWTHRFVCLSQCSQKYIPTTSKEKDILNSAGLGEKKMTIKLDATAEEFRLCLLEAFPKLSNAGGFQLCKCVPNSRQLHSLSSKSSSSPMSLRDCGGNSRTYIRPLQKDLDLTPCQENVEVGQIEETCLTCGIVMSLDDLAQHVKQCKSFSTSKTSQSALQYRCELLSEGDLSDADDGWMGDQFEVDRDSLQQEKELSPQSESIPRIADVPIDVPMINLDDDISVQVAITESLQESTCVISDNNSNPPCLEQLPDSRDNNLQYEIHRLKMDTVQEDVLPIYVRRDHVLTDAMREAHKKKFNAKKTLKVSFVGESGVDHGGPRREFFRLLAIEASEELLQGCDNGKFFTNDMRAFQDQDYFHLGQYIAMSIMQGGCGFPFLSPAVYSYLSSGAFDKSPSVEDLPVAFAFPVQKILGAEDDTELQAVLAIEELQDILFQTGWKKPLTAVTIDEKEEIISTIVAYHLLVKVKGPMDQFMEGLMVLGLAQKIRQNPSLWESLFVYTNQRLSLDKLKELLPVKFSEKGLPERQRQEQAYIFFLDFLEECEDTNECSPCTLEQILVFFTGSSKIPPLGFEEDSSLSFCDGPLATASTCSLTFKIPLCHNTYMAFKEAVSLSILGNDGFGVV